MTAHRETEDVPPTNRGIELGAAVATAAGHLITNEVGGHGVFVVVAVLGWLSHCVVTARRNGGALRAWGLGSEGMAATWRASAAPAFAVLLGSVIWGVSAGRWPLPAHAYLLVALYPLWGVVQQLLVQAFVVRHVDDAFGGRHRWATVLVGAFAFGVVHIRHLDLAAATFAFGLLATPIWLKHRNLWPLAVWHGVLGVAFYYFVLGRDPWLENFGG